MSVVANDLVLKLKEQGLSVKLDDRDERPGVKFYEWEKKGVPLRIEIGPKDVQNKKAVLVRRDTSEKQIVDISKVSATTIDLLEEIQKSLFERALLYQKNKTKEINDFKKFEKFIAEEEGFVIANWCGDEKCEAEIKEKTKATIRCIPFEGSEADGDCLCGKKGKYKVIFAKAY